MPVLKYKVNGEWVEVGGGVGSGVGKPGEVEGAEIFNDYATNKATGAYSHAEGVNTTASGNGSHAEGGFTTASGNGSHAEGGNTIASGVQSHAEGGATTASGNSSHAEGGGTIASGLCSHAEGENTLALDRSSHAEGIRTTAFGRSSHAEGFSSKRLPDTITSESTNEEIITAWNSTKFSLAKGDSSHVEGDNTLALGNTSHAEGRRSTASGEGSHAEGNGTTASGSESHAEGGATTASGVCSHAEGIRTVASGECSHAEGFSSNMLPDTITSESTNDDIITAWNENNFLLAKGIYSHAEGENTLVLGRASHAEGGFTTASGIHSHAEGGFTTASGNGSHAEGISTIASGVQSHAEGDGTTAYGEASHAEGCDTTASGKNSHAEGDNAKAIGHSSHAEGSSAAVGEYSHAEGSSYIDTVTLEGEAGATVYNYYDSPVYQMSGIILTDDGVSASIVETDPDNGTVTLSNTLSDENFSGIVHLYMDGAFGEYSHAEGFYTTASGEASHAEGYYPRAEGKASHAEGFSSYASGRASHAEGSEVAAEGEAAHAEGSGTIASGRASHAEGSSGNSLRGFNLTGDANTTTYTFTDNGNIPYIGATIFTSDFNTSALITGVDYQNKTIELDKTLSEESVDNLQVYAYGGVASGDYSHIEGESSVASGKASHAEGHCTTAFGIGSHAEGSVCSAIGDYSHAEGFNTRASGDCSHAEGMYAAAYGAQSHAEGVLTSATSGCQHVQGMNNIVDVNNQYLHIVGNGRGFNESSNAHTIDWTGNAVFAGTVSAPGADYAEHFEWADGNPDNEDRVGMIVTLEGDKIRPATAEDEILGIVSGTAMVIGDNAEWEWQGKFLTDDYGRVITEKVEEFVEIKDPKTGEVIDKKSVGFIKRRKLNPEWDATKEYTRRSDRPEWDVVGLFGKLHVTDDGTCVPNGWATVGEDGKATASATKTNMRVMKRITDNIVLVFMK